MYFLDMNIVTNLRYGNQRLKDRLADLPSDSFYIGGVVVEEIIVKGFLTEITNIRGGKSKSSIGRTSTDFLLVINHLAEFRLLPYTDDAETIYKTFKAAKPKGFDGRIAAHTLSLGFILVTQNTRDFADVPNLTVEDWMA